MFEAKLQAERDALVSRLNIVVDERDTAARRLADEKREHEMIEEELHRCIALLKERKAYYKGKVQKVRIVLDAANLLEDVVIYTRVLVDALADDPVEPGRV